MTDINIKKLIYIKDSILQGKINTKEGLELYKKEKYRLINIYSSTIIDQIKLIDNMIPLDLN